jgi:hypothetical protein
LTAAGFAAVAGHLDAVPREFDVPSEDREEVLELVGSLEDDVLADGSG